ncbi:hypothetical protein GGR51DRAFT_502667 [Nemania sp. FL0031]|nr:hypothetical protein GGR51DRAFT_502667 [Nemania sp. FL0031]
MLSFRSRANRAGGGSSESHRSLPTTTTMSPIDHKPFQASGNKNSLRGRLKDITRNIARSIPGHNRNRMSYTPDPWFHVKSNDDLLSLATAGAQHVELAGQTWPAIRKNISSMAPYRWAHRDSADSSKSPGEASHQSSFRHSRTGPRGSQDSNRRWATIATRVHPMISRRSTSDTRHSSFSTISEIMSRQDYGPAPQLPSLAESSSFLESLSKTGLFRIFTPLGEINSTTGSIKVQNVTALDDEACSSNVRPIISRRPLRLRSPDGLYPGAIGPYTIKRVMGHHQSSPDTPSNTSTANADSDFSQPNQDGLRGLRKAPKKEKSQAWDSSRHPIEWLDRVLETSYATRNPISPKLCVSKATMDILQQNRTCIFVNFPRDQQHPEPLRCYPGFRAALVDICDRFGIFYAPFAAYNARTRVITLYTTDTARPAYRFIDDDTAIFNLELARSAWVRTSIESDTSSIEVKAEPTEPEEEPASPKGPEDLAEALDYDRASTKETLGRTPETETVVKVEQPED